MDGLVLAVLATGVLLLTTVLWRKGHLSDRSMTLAIAGLAPVVSLVYAVSIGASVPVLVLVVVVAALPGALLYGRLLEFVTGQARLARSGRD